MASSILISVTKYYLQDTKTRYCLFLPHSTPCNVSHCIAVNDADVSQLETPAQEKDRGYEIDPKGTKDTISMSYHILTSFVTKAYSRAHETVLIEGDRPSNVGTLKMSPLQMTITTD